MFLFWPGLITRRNNNVLCIQEFDGIGGIKDSRVMWLGNTNKILGTGFNKVRIRQGRFIGDISESQILAE